MFHIPKMWQIFQTYFARSLISSSINPLLLLKADPVIELDM